METKWYCFLFWFSYRFTLACLAHFNWCMSIYTNCVYFTLWKSYDLLWFWMHLILCSCFPQLRPENYLIVWTNLIIKKLTKYPDYTFKQLYYALYTTNRSAHFTKRLMSRKEKKGVIELDSNSDEDEKNEPTTSRSAGNVDPEAPIPLRTIHPERSAKAIPTPVKEVPEIDDDEAEENDEEQNATETTPLRPPRPSRPKFEEPEDDEDEVIEVVTDAVAEDESPKQSPSSEPPKWKGYVPNSVLKFLPRQESNTPSEKSKASTTKDANNSTSAIGRFYDRIKFNRSNSNSSTNTRRPDELEVLRPDYTNRYDIHDKSKREAREKRDRKALRHRVRHELRMAMKADADKERARKKVTDAIELLLQLLRMMSSFAMLIGTIRKTFIPASFKYLKPGQHAYDNYELIILFRCTAFLDIAMFWMNVTYAYCLQWQLCCRLGFTRFVFWAILLGVVSTTVMFIPMTYVMNDLDLSWCRLMPNTTFAKYQPNW
uniref:G_PROTEIN_RECEP_F1_2 domain-containing protein n=1 Tax=Caenorhabditis tropicalis TaxID=1561998 RepID=A0A1I7U007_9PELO